MLGIVPRPMHAVLDYVWGAAIFAAPDVLDFADEGNAYLLCKVQGTAATVGSLLTRYELGLLKVIPYNTHLLLDLIGAIAGLASPWLLGFSGNKKARNATLAFFLFELAAVAMSKRDEE